MFICHGESDKDYMSSNQLKAYDHVFIAGQAARERILRKLIGFDESHLVEVGRPQVDVHPAGADLPHDGRTVVLYAPTTGGRRAEHALLVGRQPRRRAIVRSLVGRRAPTGSSTARTPARHHRAGAAARPTRRSCGLLRDANAADAGARHVVDTSGGFGWQVDAADVAVTDISAVAYDWLATAKPLVVTRPAEPRAELPESGLVRELTCSTPRMPGARPRSWTRRCAHPDDAHAALVHRYFGDTTPGASMERFLTACSPIVEEREAALVARGSVAGT